VDLEKWHWRNNFRSSGGSLVWEPNFVEGKLFGVSQWALKIVESQWEWQWKIGGTQWLELELERWVICTG